MDKISGIMPGGLGVDTMTPLLKDKEEQTLPQKEIDKYKNWIKNDEAYHKDKFEKQAKRYIANKNI